MERNPSSKALPSFPAYRRNVPLAADEHESQESKYSRRIPHGEICAAGSTVRESGIYEVIHDGSHRPPHEVVMISGDQFPACDNCYGRVKYRVLRTAPYIFTDEDFEEPQS